MKHLLIIPVLFSFLCGCKKENKTLPPHINAFAVKVDGVPFSVKNIELYHDSENTYLDVRAEDAATFTVIIGVTNLDYTSHSSIPMGDNAYGIVDEFSSDGVWPVGAISGNLTITRVDVTSYPNGKVVDANFNFITEAGAYSLAPYVITEGSYSVFVPN